MEPLASDSKTETRVEGRKYLVDFLVATFGISSWLAMTGLWVELPILIQRLPEGWTLASRLSLILQLANISLVIYYIFIKFYPILKSEVIAIHLQLAIGVVSCFFLIFFWSSTVQVGSAMVSLALFILSFGLSIVDCLSSVTFLPFMARYPTGYITPYLAGEGLSGFIPSIMAMAQGIENPVCENMTENNQTFLRAIIKEPNFSPESFFGLLLILVLISWTAFILLNHAPQVTINMVSVQKKTNYIDTKYKGFNDKTVISRPKYGYLLLLQTLASVATFGVFPAIQPYSCLPYGDQILHWTVIMVGMAYPFACLLALKFEVRGLYALSTLFLLGTAVSVYLMINAVMSPHPLFHGTSFGGILMVIAWTLFTALFSYVKTMVTVILRDLSHKALFWCGTVTQVGAAIGSLIMFLIINVWQMFHDEQQC